MGLVIGFNLFADEGGEPNDCRELTKERSQTVKKREPIPSKDSDTIIEEVLQDIGLPDFGQGVTAKTNVAIWRTRGEHRPLIGEFAFQVRFKDRKELARESMQRAEAWRCSTRPRTTSR